MAVFYAILAFMGGVVIGCLAYDTLKNVDEINKEQKLPCNGDKFCDECNLDCDLKEQLSEE